MDKTPLPTGWDENRVRRVLDYYEQQSDDEAVTEDEAGYAGLPPARSLRWPDGKMSTMTSRVNQLLHDVLELPADERAAVATELLASLDDAEPTDVHEVEAAWAEEIEHRARRVLSGESAGRPWEEVRRNIEANLTKR